MFFLSSVRNTFCNRELYATVGRAFPIRLRIHYRFSFWSYIPGVATNRLVPLRLWLTKCNCSIKIIRFFHAVSKKLRKKTDNGWRIRTFLFLSISGSSWSHFSTTIIKSMLFQCINYIRRRVFLSHFPPFCISYYYSQWINENKKMYTVLMLNIILHVTTAKILRNKTCKNVYENVENAFRVIIYIKYITERML